MFISDNSEDSQAIQKMIQAQFKNVEIVIASNVQETMNLAASDGPFGFILIDIDVKEIDPNALSLELLDFIGERPFIFFGSEGIFKTRITDELYNSSEYNSTLFKPVVRPGFVTELKEIIAKIKTWIKAESSSPNSPEVDPTDYMQMKLKSFYLYKKFNYDVHMAITQTSYMKLIEAGQSYTHSLLSQYAKKGIKHLYILKDDQLKFLESEANYCIRAMTNFKSNDPTQLFLIHLRAITIFHDYLKSLGPTLLAQQLLEKTAESVIEQVKTAGSFKEILKSYPIGYAGISSKSLLTAHFSLELANALNWDSHTTRLKLVASSILQDYSLPDDALTFITDKEDPRLVEFDLEANNEYLEHPAKAAEMSHQFSRFPDIDFILANHHELPNREGFPNRPSMTSLTLLNAVFNICQCIASHIDGKTIKQESLNKVLKSMSKEFNLGIFKEPMKKMTEIFKFN